MSDSPESPPPASPPPASPPPASAKTPYEQAVELKELGLNSAEIKAKLLDRGLDAESAAILAHGVGAADPRPPLIELNVAQPLREGFKDLLARERGHTPGELPPSEPGPSEPTSPTASPRRRPVETLVAGLLCLFGVAVAVTTYTSVINQGAGAYVIAAAAILLGAIGFIRGVTRGD